MPSKVIKPTLTLEDRKKIKKGLDMNLTYSQLSEFVGKNKSTVLRESKRLGSLVDYDPFLAQKNYELSMIRKNKKMSETKKNKHANLVKLKSRDLEFLS